MLHGAYLRLRLLRGREQFCARPLWVLPFVLWAFAGTATAQEQRFDPVAMAWTDTRPLFYSDADGEPTGIAVEFARTLARELGFELAPYRISDFPTWRRNQTDGTSEMLPMAAKIPAFAETNLYSDTIFSSDARFAVRAEDANTFDPTDLAGVRVGTLPPGAGSNPDLYPGATVLTYPNTGAAVIALLSNEIDTVSTESSLVYAEARAARLDHRIVFVGPPVETWERVIILHKSRSELLEPINDVIARMRADGRIDELREAFQLRVPPTAPDVLTVGVTDFPPYNIQNDDGTFAGFSVETMRDLAKLAGLSVTFKAITLEEFGDGPSPTTYDMITQAAIGPERLVRMDFTAAIERFEYSIFTRAGEAEGLSDLDSLVGRKVGVGEVNLARRLAEDHGGLDLTTFEDTRRLLQGLVDGTVDAVLFPRLAMETEIRNKGLNDDITEVKPAFHVVERAPALRFGLGAVRERLNAVIPGYLLSDDYVALRDKYFSESVFWTDRRITISLEALGALLLLLLGSLFWQRQRQRKLLFERQKQDLLREKAYSEELGTLVTELERSNRGLDEFAYIASHDLKEPLRGIAINANFLLRDKLTGKAKERAERMMELTGRMEQLISDLLSFSRLGQSGAAREIVEPAKIIAAIRSELKEWLAERGAEIVETGAIPTLKADRVRVKSVLQNLIVNAIIYNDADKKRVEVGFVRDAEVQGEIVKDAIFVKDNGIGIGEEYHEKIFRIFSRLNKQADYGSGSGSGLAFVRKIAEEHGGMVDFVSTPGEGSTFYVTLPLDNPAANQNPI